MNHKFEPFPSFVVTISRNKILSSSVYKCLFYYSAIFCVLTIMDANLKVSVSWPLWFDDITLLSEKIVAIQSDSKNFFNFSKKVFTFSVREVSAVSPLHQCHCTHRISYIAFFCNYGKFNLASSTCSKNFGEIRHQNFPSD